MQAGREMDALVAEKVMGWTYRTFPDGAFPHIKHWHGPNDESLLPPYSTSIQAAWAVVEKMHANHWQFDLDLYEGDPVCACFYRKLGEYGKEGAHCKGAATAPLAICLAALEAVGVEVT